jgi:hypothetical protein
VVFRSFILGGCCFGIINHNENNKKSSDAKIKYFYIENKKYDSVERKEKSSVTKRKYMQGTWKLSK